MKNRKKFILQTFNGTLSPEEYCDSNENYWILINEKGSIVNSIEKINSSNKRVLFQFDCNVISKGLECHNSEPNSLWILMSDLKKTT